MSKKYFFASIITLAAASLLPVANAQSEGEFEEIIVMATKRPQTLQEVPVAVTVVGSEDLERAQINDILDLQSVVPSLRITQLQTAGNTNFVIRGFGNGANNPGIEPSVGVFVDGVYRSRTSGSISDLANVERIEVLRGPQSTLFGKNASAGVINVVTAAPNIDSYSGGASVVIGNFDQVIVKGDITGPISENVAFSLSATGNQRDGYFTNLVSGNELNERDRFGLRGQLLILPSDSVSLRVIADYDEIDEACCGVGNIVANPLVGGAIAAVGGNLVGDDVFALEQFLDFDPTNVIENSGLSLQADIDFENGMLLTSVTAYRNQSRFDNGDVDFTSASLVSRNSGDTELDTFTQELRLSNSTDSLDWMVGGFYFDETVDYDNEITFGPAFRPYGDLLTGGAVTLIESSLGVPAGTFLASGQGTIEDSGQDDQTYSIFGQIDWHVSDRATITLGANFTNVEKDAFVRQTNTDVFSTVDLVPVGFGLIFGQLTGGLPPTPANIAANPAAAGAAQAFSPVICTAATGPACNPLLGPDSVQGQLQLLPPVVSFPNAVENGKSSDSETTWTARIAFDATDTINVYASAATGFKATSWNLSRDTRPVAGDIPALIAAGLGVPNLVDRTRFAGPEDSTVYEIGMKGRWGPHYVNVAIFDQEIEGFQSNVFTGTGFALVNAGKQSTTGLEIEALWVPTDSFKWSFAATLLDPEYDSFPNGNGVDGIEDLSGTAPAGVHEVSISTSGTYEFDIGADKTGFIRAEYRFEDEVQIVENVPFDIASREESVINASAGVSWDNGYQILLWGRNLTDDEFLLSTFPSVAQDGSFSGYPNQPRTYGVTFSATFE